MALTIIESLVLWGFPLLMLGITLSYYLYWGKEPEEREPATDASSSANGGDL